MTQVYTPYHDKAAKSGGAMSSVRMNIPLRETIHSGHFMVSEFEPDSEVLDDEYEAGMPVPPGEEDFQVADIGGQGGAMALPQSHPSSNVSSNTDVKLFQPEDRRRSLNGVNQNASVIIDGSLTKLFQCMTLAYRQKLTSPKWNRFKGVRLRWKDKIRLNNVIWRCWHMQFILKQKALVCQFASPLDVDQHNKPEAVVMEGKYWKRKLSTVTAEYKKWRLFYRNKIMGWTLKETTQDLHPVSLDGLDWNRQVPFGSGPMSNLIFDDDFLMDFSDTLFSSLSSNQFAFPNPRELTRAGMVADFIQPGLIQLQPNLDDFMDTLEPLHDFMSSKLLPPVPEELDAIEPPDSLLPVDVMSSVMQKQMAQQRSLENKVQGRQGNSPGPSPNAYPSTMNQAMQDYYGMPMSSSIVDTSGASSQRLSSLSQPQPTVNVPAPSSLATQPSSTLSAMVKRPSSHTTSSGSSSRKNKSSSQESIFAVPKSKGPRSRSRNSAASSSIRQALQSSPAASCPPPSNNTVQHQMIGVGATSLPHGQISSGVASSSTLLSHLLTSSGGAIEAMGAMQGPGPSSLTTNSLMGSGVGSVNLMNTGLHNSKEASSSQQPQTSWSNRTTVGVGALSPTVPEHRRVCHINAEQKRRCNIKNGFDMLHSLIPQLSQNSNSKVSKAAMLQKGAEYIRQLKQERAQLKEEIDAHKAEVEALNAAINNCQSMLPATGAPVSRQRTNKMKEMFDQWVRIRTLDNWKFWIFSILIRPLLDSYNNAVSTASLDELCRTVLAWVDQHCSLVDLRPAVLNSLRLLCTTTDILTNPANLPEEAYAAVNQPPEQEQLNENR